MAQSKREKSKKYPGVYHRVDRDGKDRTFYIMYRQGGRDAKLIEEPVGKASCGMTEAKASQIRGDRIRGKELSNTEKRRAIVEAKETEKKQLTIEKIWITYQAAHPEHKSRARDISRYNKHIGPSFGKLCPEEMITADIDEFKIAAIKDGKSPGTIQRVLSQLRAIINFGVKRGLCPVINPAKLSIDSIRVDNQKTEVLTDEQMKRLVEALDAEPDQDSAGLIRLAMVTGMRKGALLALKWEDCDFEKGIIRLTGKNAKSGITDYIPMNEAAREILKKITPKSEYVFPGKNGGKRNDFRRIARRVKEKAGLPEDFRPLHGLRHNFASYLASSGSVDLYTLQKLLTHSSPQMTMRYAHLADEALKKASNIAVNIIQKDKANDKK